MMLCYLMKRDTRGAHNSAKGHFSPQNSNEDIKHFEHEVANRWRVRTDRVQMWRLFVLTSKDSPQQGSENRQTRSEKQVKNETFTNFTFTLNLDQGVFST